MRRRGILLLWLGLAVLAVAAGALMPGLVLRVQDERLESAVESAETETVDLSLLSELDLAQTLYLASHYDSYVVLDRGRLMTAQEAADTTLKFFDTLQESYGVDLQRDVPEVTRAEPRLYMGRNGENVVFWYVELAGRGVPFPMAMVYGTGDRCQITGSLLLDERSGGVATLDISWHSPDPDTELPEQPAAQEEYGAEEAGAPEEYGAEAAVGQEAEEYPEVPSLMPEEDAIQILGNLSYDLFWRLTDTIGGELDLYDLAPGLYRVTLPDGTEFEVCASLTLYSIQFNR